MTDNVFTQSPNQGNDTSSNPFDQWVGEGKKYSSVEEMAKANIHAQEHITGIETTLTELREDLSKRETLDDLYGKITSNNQQNSQPVTPTPESMLSKDDITSLINSGIQDGITNFNTTNVKTQNTQQVSDELVKLYGDKAQEQLVNKATELGMSFESMTDLASNSPQAVLAYFNSAPSTQTSSNGTATMQSDFSTQASQQQSGGTAEHGTYQYYEALRKSNPNLYFSPKVQKEMHDQAVANRDTFFN